MNKLTRASLLLALACSPLAAEAQEQPAGSITGFSSIPWGSPESVITEKYGTPAQVTESNGLKVIAFAESILDEDTGVWFYLHPQNGLVAGAYTTPYGFGEDCWAVYVKFRDTLLFRYPNIRPRRQESNQSRSLDFCAALGINRAAASVVWDDRANGARAFVEIHNEGRYVQTMYVSAQGLQSVQQAQAGERAERF
jgi:hypothetical protein